MMKKSFLIGSLLTVSCWLAYHLNNRNEALKPLCLLVSKSKQSQSKLAVAPKTAVDLDLLSVSPEKNFLPAKALQLPVASDHNLKRNSMQISSKKQAVDWVSCHFGDNQGDWDWNCIWENDEVFFVKATSKQLQAAGSMTGTAMSVLVKRNGKMDWNF